MFRTSKFRKDQRGKDKRAGSWGNGSRGSIPRWSALIFILSFLLLSACTPRVQGDAEGASAALDHLHRRLLEESFAFDGSVSMRKEKSYGDHIAVVTGLVQKNRDLYMNVSTSPEGNGAMEDYDIFTSGRDLYMRFADEVEWQPVQHRSDFINEEIDHWNPLAHFERMRRLAQRIYFDRKASGDLSTLVVELDARLLKQNFIENVKNRLAAKRNGDPGTKFERLSTGNAGDDGVVKELEALQKEIRQGVDDLERTLAIDGQYFLSYNNKTGLPTKLVYRQQINYTEGGEPNYENSKLELVLRDFGTNEDIPDRLGLKANQTPPQKGKPNRVSSPASP